MYGYWKGQRRLPCDIGGLNRDYVGFRAEGSGLAQGFRGSGVYVRRL